MSIKPSVLSLITVLASFLLTFAGQSVHAQQLTVNAPVVGVEPIYATPRSHCDVPSPPQEAGIGAALQWDLAGRCRVEVADGKIVRWRVQYQWDNRTFTVETSRKPGKEIPITIRLN